MQKSLSNAALKKILETTNERDLFIVGHMYIENMIDRILEKEFNIPSKSIDSTLFTLNLKMDILTESGLIKGNVKKNVELLARIRNRYAHKLEPNEQRITITFESCSILDLYLNLMVNMQSIESVP